MNRRLIVGILAVVFLGIVGAVALLVGGGGRSSGLPSDSLPPGTTATESRPAPAAEGGRYSRTGARPTGAPDSAGSTDGTGAAGAGTAGAVQPGSGLPGDPLAGLDTSKFGAEFWRDVNFFDDPELLDELVKEFGSMESLYAAAPAEVREQLVNFLLANGNLREHLPQILPVESDSEARADILGKVVPEGFFDPEGKGEIPVDRELIKLMDTAMPTPIQEDEWLARMELARLIDPDYAMDWAREADDVFPASDPVKINASAMTLMMGGAGAEVSSAERQQAESYLFSQTSSPNWMDVDVNDRIQAYYGLNWAEDSDRAQRTYQGLLDKETDEARNVLDSLID